MGSSVPLEKDYHATAADGTLEVVDSTIRTVSASPIIAVDSL
jgi:hypothetical protein